MELKLIENPKSNYANHDSAMHVQVAMLENGYIMTKESFDKLAKQSTDIIDNLYCQFCDFLSKNSEHIYFPNYNHTSFTKGLVESISEEYWKGNEIVGDLDWFSSKLGIDVSKLTPIKL